MFIALQAMEQYEGVKAREREQQEELDEARGAARSATLAFEELRQERTELFMAAFQHVADTIDGVYTVRLNLGC
jgi:structural maintenance of chromosome 1